MVHSKLFFLLRSTFLTSVPWATYVFAEDVADGGLTAVNTIFNASSLTKDISATRADPKAPEESVFWETHMEAIVCFSAVLIILGLNQYHHMFGRSTKKVDKLGYVEERLEEIAELMPPRKKPMTGAAKRKVKSMKALETSAARFEAAKKEQEEKAKYNEVLLDHAKKLNVDGLENTLQEMENRFGSLLMTDYSLVISHVGKAGDPIKAHKWLRRALEVGHVPNQCTFNAVINAYTKHGDIKQALHVAGDMRRLGLEFDTITYNTIIEAWARAGDATTCQLWMKRMLASGVKASVVTFGSVMRACANAGLTTEIEEWYAMSQKLSIELNLICFSSVVNAFARRDDLVNATKWLTRCIEHGVQPNVQCFTGVLTSVLNTGQLDLAAMVIERMRAADVQPDGGVFSQCVVVAAKAGERKRAQDWADECVACKCKLTRAAETALIQARLRVPNFKKEKKAPEGALAEGQNGETEMNPEEVEAKRQLEEQQKAEERKQAEEARRACVGKRYQGTIKEFIQHKFGYILCDETFALFQRDVFLRSEDNPDLLAKGQRVSFTLRIDHRGGLPRASDVRVYRPSLW